MANIVTESLHIPGGIATSFSLMFLIVAASVLDVSGCATLMSVVQSMLAFAFGMVGSMGALAPIGYILPGIAVDICLYISKKYSSLEFGILSSSLLSSVCACLTANLIVFNLSGIVLAVYVSVAATSGAICSLLTIALIKRLSPLIKNGFYREQTHS